MLEKKCCVLQCIPAFSFFFPLLNASLKYVLGNKNLNKHILSASSQLLSSSVSLLLVTQTFFCTTHAMLNSALIIFWSLNCIPFALEWKYFAFTITFLPYFLSVRKKLANCWMLTGIGFVVRMLLNEWFMYKQVPLISWGIVTEGRWLAFSYGVWIDVALKRGSTGCYRPFPKRTCERIGCFVCLFLHQSHWLLISCFHHLFPLTRAKGHEEGRWMWVVLAYWWPVSPRGLSSFILSLPSCVWIRKTGWGGAALLSNSGWWWMRGRSWTCGKGSSCEVVLAAQLVSSGSVGLWRDW